MARRRRTVSVEELDFQGHVMLAAGALRDFRIHRQNVGSVAVRSRTGKVLRVFHAGPPVGASDLSGIVRPEGWRLEIELKSATGVRSPAQIRWADHIREFGGVYVLIAFDEQLSLGANVDAAVAAIHEAIRRRRGG